MLAPIQKRHVVAFAVLAMTVLPGAMCGKPSPPPSQISRIIDPFNKTPVAGSGVTLLVALEFAPTAVTQSVWEMINGHRMENNSGVLAWDQISAGCALRHSNNMVSGNFFSLVSPTGVDVIERMVSSSPPTTATLAQYFIVQGVQDPDDLVMFLIWNASTRAILEYPQWRSIGIGYNAGNGGTWTIVFTNT
jgi:uncharacterized protein YkwD